MTLRELTVGDQSIRYDAGATGYSFEDNPAAVARSVEDA